MKIACNLPKYDELEHLDDDYCFLSLPVSRLQGSVCTGSIEAGTGFGYVWQLSMAYDAGGWIAPLQCLQEGQQGGFLCLCTGVGWVAFFVKASLVADAYR